MSFLTPLYLLGVLAVSLPIVFHMIRRTPRDRREFSSVMFLQPSPPKITRRSRIEHWLLLLLRALAVCLLALAFARPFFRQSDHQAIDATDGRAFVALLDTSASMRRDGVWEEAVDQLADFLRGEVLPTDRVTVLGFDEALQSLCSFEQWLAIDPGQRTEAVLKLVEETQPRWQATDLGGALMEAAERLDALSTDEPASQRREIVVISDLQAGSRLESLQAYDWPRGIGVTLLPVGDDASPNNAGLHPVADASIGSRAQAQRTRVRVTNADGADRDEFRIRWTDEFDTAAPTTESTGDASSGDIDDLTVSVIVPAGQSRIVRAAARPDGPGVGRLRLDGDEHDFDNTCYVPPPRPRSAVVALLSDGADDDPQGMAFYLPPALPSLPQREIRLIKWGETTGGETTADDVQLVIVTSALPTEQVKPLRDYVRKGGTLLFAASTAEELADIDTLFDVPPVAVGEADVADYAMLTDINFAHPLFAALDDPRFADFTKVRIWKHRTFSPDSLPDAKVLARFDDGDAAVIESPLSEGRVILLTFGWQPDDSQLAVSTKFVPMLSGLVDDVAGIVERRTTYLVGEPVSLAEFDLSRADLEAVRTPSGERVTLAEDADTFTATESPGVYKFLLRTSAAETDDAPTFAVNLDPAESRTSRLPDDALVAAGVRLSAEESTNLVDAAAQRQLRAAELEDRQKLWRWLVVGVIVLLMAETLLASRAARRQLTSA